MQIIQSIQRRIYEIRGERIILDRDVAALYGVETKRLSEAVKRNHLRFPPDFMFRLTREEFQTIKNQADAVEMHDKALRPQIATLETARGRHSKYLPCAFTEQGIAMLSSVLHAKKAIALNIAIMRAFAEIRKMMLQQNFMQEQLKEIKERLGGHDAQLNQIYEALENLLNEKAGERKWDNRERIGFIY
jgi:phage regulator Rha-like protein